MVIMSLKVNSLSSPPVPPVRPPPFLPGTSSALSSRLQSFEKPSPSPESSSALSSLSSSSSSSSSSCCLSSPRRSSSMGSVDTGNGNGGKPKEGMVSQIASRFMAPPPPPPEKPRILKKPELLKERQQVAASGLSSKVERTQSHQTRFNHARAMFEKMGGSTEELLDGPSLKNNWSSLRSRSVSPQEEGQVENGVLGGRKISLPDPGGAKVTLSGSKAPPATTSCVPSAIKELTHKQRNWFSHFEKGKGLENGAQVSKEKTEEEESPQQEEVALEEPLSEKEAPSNKSPLSAKNSSSSSDCIEDYIRNWKKSSSPTETPSRSPPSEERLRRNHAEDKESPEVLHAVTKILEHNISEAQSQSGGAHPSVAKPALSPKPPPDIVKRLSFNGKNSRPGLERRGSLSSSSDENHEESSINSRGTLVTALAVTVREEDSEDMESPQLSQRLHREFNFPRQNGTEFAKSFAQGMIYDASLDDLKSDKILVDDGSPLILESASSSKLFPSLVESSSSNNKVEEESCKSSATDEQSLDSSSDEPVTMEDEEDPVTVVHKSPSVSSVSSSAANEVPFMDEEESNISPLCEKEPPTLPHPNVKAAPQNGHVLKGKEESSSSSDEYQEELQFDATVSSGHLGFKEDNNNGDFRSTPIKLGLEESKSSPVIIEEMTPNEADMLLSSNLVEKRLTDDQAREVVRLLSPDKENISKLAVDTTEDLLVAKAASEALDKLDHLVYKSDIREEAPLPPSASEEPEESIVLIKDPAKEVFFDECTGVHYLDDGHYWFEVDGIDPASAHDGSPTYYKSPGRLSFSKEPIRQFSTYSVDEYDRRNDEIDPVAASAEYELEKRVEKMDTFDVELLKGPEGLGLSIIGMGVGADTGLEKLGVFVKTVTPGGPATGLIKVNDLIIEVDGKSLVGVTQAYASSVLQNTSGVINFVIGRDKDPENSEVAQLIRQSLQADLDRAERQRQQMSQLEPYDSSEHTSVTNSSTVEGEHTIQEEDEEFGGQRGGERRGGESYAMMTSPEEDDSISSPENRHSSSSSAHADLAKNDPKAQKLRADIQILKRKLEEAQYRNMAIEAEMEEMRSKFASKSSRNNYDEQQIQTERTNLTESGIQTSLTLEDQEKSKDLERKYAHAKRIIHELKEHEQFLALQLQERDQGYHNHLKLLIDRVIQLENELASTQKYAGIPISLPYNHDGNSLLSPPELLKRKPVLLTEDDDPILDISESEDVKQEEEEEASSMDNKDIKEEFDSAIPAHELLDIRANKFKAELATKGAMMSQRHRPTPDALRSNVLKRSISTASASSFITTDSFELDQESCSESREATPDSDSGYMAATCVAVSSKAYNKPLPPLPKANPPISPSKNPNFLAEMNNAVQRRQEQQRKPQSSSANASATSSSSALISLADQLKSSLEERRKAAGGSEDPDDLVADIKQAVKIANDNVRKPSSSVHHQAPSTTTTTTQSVIIPTVETTSHSSYYSSSSYARQHQYPAVATTANANPNNIGQHSHPSPSNTSSYDPRSNNNGGGGIVLISQNPIDPNLLPTNISSAGTSSGAQGGASRHNIEPTDMGIIPPEFRSSSSNNNFNHSPPAAPSATAAIHSSPPRTFQESSATEPMHSKGNAGGSYKNSNNNSSANHQAWSANPVEEWAKEQVCQWLLALGMESYITLFMDKTITGAALLNFDSNGLKELGIKSKEDREKIKKKIKELKAHNEKDSKKEGTSKKENFLKKAFNKK